MWKASRVIKNNLRRASTNWVQETSIPTVTPTVSRVVDVPTKSSTTDYTVGNEIEGFVVNRVEDVKEFDLKAISLTHLKTKAQYIHLARADQNNAFCVGFRTTPFDSSGLPHILEHITLCGSQKFPCRDPFFKMLNRSMATFMNAATGPDYTVYPFSTQNRTDYSNLMSVYLDAVFNPLLTELDFLQEGWRLEHEIYNDSTSPIVIKGVVYNEMKGALSENQSVFAESLLNNILPSHTYGFISGGDPAVIPSLTYSDLKAFHKKYYHPSNSRFYSYGNFPLRDHLKYANEYYLNNMEGRNSTDTAVPPEPRWSDERRVHVDCKNDLMAADPAKQSSIAISYLCNDIRNVQDTFAIHVLSELLVKGPNTPFYKSLVEPNIGGGYSPVTGYDNQTRDTMFSVGLQAMNPADFDRVVDIYDKTINDVIDEGFDENQIKAVLHNIELTVKHQTADFGLSMAYGMTPLWNHDGDVIQALRVNDQLAKFKKQLQDNPRYLQDVTKNYLKDNKHRLILTMSPNDNYEQNLIKKEQEILNDKLKDLDENQKTAVYTQGLKLAEAQDSNKDASCLPTLTTNDLNSDVERILPKKHHILAPIYLYDTPTNGLTYLRGVMNTWTLPDQSKNLIPLLCNIITKMGTKKHHYREFDQLVQLRTGGLSFSTHIADNIVNPSSFEESVIFFSFCLDKYINTMVGLWEELFTGLDLSNKTRFETLLKMNAANLANGIADSGHGYAMMASSALVCPVSKLKEQLGGITYIQYLKKIAQQDELDSTLKGLNEVAQKILKKETMRVSVNTSLDNEDQILRPLERLLTAIPSNFSQEQIYSSGILPMNSAAVHHVLNFPVSFSAHSCLTVPYTHPDHPSLRVLARLLTSKYLLPRVREKGGAYGTGANVSSGGVFNFYSYRDPKPLKTFETFDGAQSWILKGDFTDQEIEEAKLGVFQTVDAPIPPSTRGMREFLYGISNDVLQEHRQLLKAVDRESIVKAVSLLKSPVQGRALLGPENNDILQRTSDKWTVKQIT